MKLVVETDCERFHDARPCEPGRLLAACGNRRKARCPSCSETYRADTFQLIKASPVGGKTVPEAMGTYGPMASARSGCGGGEIAGLRIGRLDFLRHTITVDRQLTRGLHGRMIETDPKTKAGRRPSLALPDGLMAMLAAVLALRGVTAAEPDALLFVAPEGTPSTTPTGASGCWMPARTAAGLPTLNVHDFKHTAGTALLDDGINIKIAQTCSVTPTPAPPSPSTPR